MKLTVSEYAKGLNISVQTVYRKVKQGVITITRENNVIYVVVDEDWWLNRVKHNVKQGLNKVKHHVKQDSNELLSLVKSQQKEIKRLTKKLEKCNKVKEDVFLQYIQEIKSLKQIQAPIENKEEDIIEVKEEDKKKKSKKKDKKKKKGKKWK
jgi:hypothetical protein